MTACALPNDDFRYAYGKPGQAPELELIQTQADVVYTPWPGIGRYIWSTLMFRNGAYGYELHASIDKLTENARPEGTLTVYKGDEILSSKSCDTATLTESLWDLEARF